MRIWKIGVLAVLVAALTRSSRRPAVGRAATLDEDSVSAEDEAGLESFPASDPPSWTLGTDDPR